MRRRRVILVGGLIGVGIYKFTKRDADRIEQHTGVPPEELEDADLERAMADLHIERQTVSSDDHQGATASEPTDTTNLDELNKVAELHSSGVLTDEEFATMKARLLGL